MTASGQLPHCLALHCGCQWAVGGWASPHGDWLASNALALARQVTQALAQRDRRWTLENLRVRFAASFTLGSECHARARAAVTVKVIVVGNGGVGKTSMTTLYAKGRFTDTYKKTIGASELVRCCG